MWRAPDPSPTIDTPTTHGDPPRPRRARALAVARRCVVGAVLLTAAFVVFVLYLNDPPRLGAIPFERAAWQTGRDEPSATEAPWNRGSLRLKMTRSLLAQYRLAGMTWTQVVALLGEPDNRWGPTTQPQAIAYDLGYPRDNMVAAHPFPHPLIVEVDATGKVSHWRVGTGECGD